MIRKIFAILIVFSVLITILKKHVLWVVGLVGAYFLIRWIADLFWWGRDSGKW